MKPARFLAKLLLAILVFGLMSQPAVALGGKKPVIRSIVPYSAGIGQMVTIQGFNICTQSNPSLTVVTVTQKTVPFTPFLFQAPSNNNEIYVRLPDTLAAGGAKITIKTLDDNLVSAAFSISITAKPQPPVLRKMVSVDDFSTITQASPGQDVGIQGFGTDTVGGSAVFLQGATSVTVPLKTTWSSGVIGIVSVYTVPATFVPGPAFVQIKLTTAHGTGKVSYGLLFTVVSP
ncbi:MAG: hypothetical protein LAO22_11070 [Acidobacteriia bacterium]|nr:hypothetical protein [Terriglobia bacterium]